MSESTMVDELRDGELEQLLTIPLLRDLVDIALFATGADLARSGAVGPRADGKPDAYATDVNLVELLASNGHRKGATIYNDSTATVYVLLGARASVDEWTVKMQPGNYYELPLGYRGTVTAVCSEADVGVVRVTEFGW